MKKVLEIFMPIKTVSKTTTTTIFLVWIIGTFALWTLTTHKFIPSPFGVVKAFTYLFTEQNFGSHLLISTGLCVKAMLYAIGISFLLAVLSVFPAFKPIASISGKLRFLSTVGLTFIFSSMTTNDMKIAILVFCIVVFMVTSFLGIIFEVKRDDIEYARTLKLNRWQVLWFIYIRGRLDQYLEAIKQNFAIAWIMLAMVENICRAEGGVGVIIAQESKMFRVDDVYAIQLMVLIIGIGIDRLLGFLREFFCPYSVIKLNK